ncbi:MAG: glycosyl transferase [Akkermansiaceae bacterium]|nr:glycosyl transferase [Akkermansiaceae bacterium]
MTSTPKTVVLADSRWAGHHQTYLFELSAGLLRCGARVILLCPYPELIRERLTAAGYDASSEKLGTVVFQSSNRSFLSKSRDHDPLTTAVRWHRTGRLIRKFEAARGWKADIVFFPYLDSYLRFLPLSIVPEILLGLPWSGLYFRNHHLATSRSRLTLAAKGDYLLRSSSCRSVCVLDERFNDRIAEISHKTVIDFPDMTDETPPVEEVPEAAKIRTKAAGRKIIGLISMERRKGLVTLLRAAVAAYEAREPWFFVATGPMLRDTFTVEEIAYCEEVKGRIQRGEIDNLYFNTNGNRIPDGAVYNSVFTSFDVVWAAYEEFEGSSNALTKASIFKIPVVASAGQCIGSRVEQFKMGTTFPERDVMGCIEAIRRILRTDTAKEHVPDFDGYYARHSRTRLDAILGELMAQEA